jgi:superfamily II DNA or RNA helicase
MTAPAPSLSFDGGTLALTGFEAEGLQRISPEIPWTKDDRNSTWRTDGFYYRPFREALGSLAGEFQDSVAQWEAVEWPAIDLHELRPEQSEAVEAWMSQRSGCVIMPTGTGKTEVALTLMAKLGVSTLVVSPVRDLMYQWHRRILAGLGYDPGIVGDSVFRVKPVSVTTYDSAFIHMPNLGNRFGMIVFDECHHLPGGMRREAAIMSAAPYRLGLSATPERSDGRDKDLASLIGPTCYRLELDRVRGHSVADYEVVRIPVHLNDEERRRYSELSAQVQRYIADRREETPDYGWEDLCSDSGRDTDARRVMRAFHTKKAIEDRATEKLRVLEDLFRLHAGQPVLIFAGSNAMAREISLRFLIPCLLNHCGKKERLDILSGLESARYPAIVANQVLDEGVDLPAINVAIVLGGGASTRQSKQRLGRILRRSGRGGTAVLYEVVTDDTTEVQRSRKRRRNDAYQGTRHRRI